MLRIKAPKAPGGFIDAEEGDCINGNFIRTGQAPICRGLAATIAARRNELWIIVSTK